MSAWRKSCGFCVISDGRLNQLYSLLKQKISKQCWSRGNFPQGSEPYWKEATAKTLKILWIPTGWHTWIWEEWFWLLVERKYDDISLEVMIRFELCVHVCSKWVSGAELSSAIYSLIHNSSESHKWYGLSREWQGCSACPLSVCLHVVFALHHSEWAISLWKQPSTWVKRGKPNMLHKAAY